MAWNPQDGIPCGGYKSIAEFAKAHNLSYYTAYWRFKNYGESKRLTAPPRPKILTVEGKTLKEWAHLLTKATGREVTTDTLRCGRCYYIKKGNSPKKAFQIVVNRILKRAVRDGLNPTIQPRDDI